MTQYPICPCCDAGREAYDEDRAPDDPDAEIVDETCDDCMGKATDIHYHEAPR